MHERQPFPILIVALILVIFVLQVVANYFYLFWTFPWFDNPMHFLGGVWVAAVSLWLYYASGRFGKKEYNTKNALLLAFFSTLIIGAGFEVYEYLINVVISDYLVFNQDYIADTSLDLVMDVLGAIFAFVLFDFERRGRV